MPYLSGIVALITIVLSGTVYVAMKWDALRAAYWGRDELQFVSFNSNNEICFVNTGDRDLFIHYVVFETSDPKSKNMPRINRVVRHGELLVFDAKGNKENTIKAFWTVTGRTAEFYKKVFRGQPTRETYTPTDEEQAWLHSFTHVWYSENHPELLAYCDFDPSHIADEGTATVVFYRMSDFKRLTLAVPCKALVVQKATKEDEQRETPKGLIDRVLGPESPHSHGKPPTKH